MELLNKIWEFVLIHGAAFTAGTTTFILFYFFRAVGLGYLKKLADKTTSTVDDFIVNLLRSFQLVFALALSVIIGFAFSDLTIADIPAINVIAILVITYQIVRLAKVIFNYTASKVSGIESANSFRGLMTIIQLIIWSLGILFMLDQLGYDITAVIAGLGIGGVAVALGLQSILADIFSSFSIYFDKPFEIGDFIKVGTLEGNVERIGLKTTRIRSLQGEQIVMSNTKLTDTDIQNFGKLQRRRVVVHLGFEYETSDEQLDCIVDHAKTIVDAVEGVTFDRMHFKSLGDSALIYELVYFVESGEYIDYVNAEHKVNTAIAKHYRKENIGLAYPTQTIYVKK